RVAAVDLARVRENIRLYRDDVHWGPNNRFRFPLYGGTGAIWRELARRLADRHPGKLRMGRPLLRLDTAHHRAHFPGGETVGSERLLTTAPLDQLVERSDLAAALVPAVARLRHSSTHVIGLGLHGQPDDRLVGKCWVYFPDGSSPFYRATVFSHYS